MDDGKLRVAWILVSAFLGAIGGLVLAEVIAYSLIEISVAPPFAIVFGVGFCLLGIALCWRIWMSIPGRLKKSFFLLFALVVFASGVACFFLQKNWFHDVSTGAKIPLYAALGMSFAFSLTFSFSELIVIGPCRTCCGIDLEENPIFGTPKQIIGLFVTTLSMGAAFGFLFGLTDVEDNLDHTVALTRNTLYSIPLGILFGGIFGALNQFWRSQKVGYDEIRDNDDDDSKF